MKKLNNNKKLNILLPCIAVILWMALIFILSAQPAEQSNGFSRKVTETITKIVNKIIPGADFKGLNSNHYIRKNAHFFIYLIFGILTSIALRKNGVVGVRSMVLVLLICILYSISDELHQAFVPGRGPQIKDVLIDGAGAVVGGTSYLVFIKINKQFKS